MPARLGVVFGALLMTALLVGCGSDSGSGGEPAASESASAPEAKTVPVAAFTPKAALLTDSDLPGFVEVQSTPGDGICGFRLVGEAVNGGRATFENTEEGALVEHLVLLFDGNAKRAVNEFVSATEACETGTNGDYTLSYAVVPVEGITAEQVVGVKTVSTSGEPAIEALTIVARDGEEVISVAAVTTAGAPKARATQASRTALKRLRRVRAAAK